MTDWGLTELETGRGRPRHQRFQRALAALCRDLGVPYRHEAASNVGRAAMHATTRWRGFRAVRSAVPARVAVVHQALNVGAAPYLAEFDVPLAVHGYVFQRYLRTRERARAKLEHPRLRLLLTFSDWARRSFGLHFGAEVEAKCRVIYPLAVEAAAPAADAVRRFDFAFISRQFLIKAGPEAVRAFAQARRAHPTARMCVVTGLDQARAALGDLSRYEGVEWREATLGEAAVATLLRETRCLVHPSLSDSFGVVVAEALAAGCAVIATDIASFPELVSADNGWLLRAPTASVVGDTFIAEYGVVAYHDRYLRRLSLHALEGEIAESMRQCLGDVPGTAARMHESLQRFDRLCSLRAWRSRMHDALREGFPELELPPAG